MGAAVGAEVLVGVGVGDGDGVSVQVGVTVGVGVAEGVGLGVKVGGMNCVGEGDSVVLRGIQRGVHVGEWLGVPRKK